MSDHDKKGPAEAGPREGAEWPNEGQAVPREQDRIPVLPDSQATVLMDDYLMVPPELMDEINAAGAAWKDRAERAETELASYKADTEKLREILGDSPGAKLVIELEQLRLSAEDLRRERDIAIGERNRYRLKFDWARGKVSEYCGTARELADVREQLERAEAEIEALRKLCFEASSRVSVKNDEGILHDRLIDAASGADGEWTDLRKNDWRKGNE